MLELFRMLRLTTVTLTQMSQWGRLAKEISVTLTATSQTAVDGHFFTEDEPSGLGTSHQMI